MSEQPDAYYVIILCSKSQVVTCTASHYFPWDCGNSDQSISWTSMINRLLHKVLRLTTEPLAARPPIDLWRGCRLVRMLRLWFPVAVNHFIFLHRYIFFKWVSPEEQQQLKLQPDYQWTPIELALERNDFDPESEDLLRQALRHADSDWPFLVQELPQTSFICQADADQVLAWSNKSSVTPSEMQAVLLSAAKFGVVEQMLCYRDFIRRCLPRLFMDRSEFGRLMSRLGWPDDQMQGLFNSFQMSGNTSPFVSFNELSLGLAICQPSMQHGQLPGEMRCRYIFRFYDRNRDNKLDFDEFCCLVSHIRRSKNLSLDPEDVATEAAITSKVFGGDDAESLSLSDFLTGVGQLKFRGTSTLLRSSISAVDFYLQQAPTQFFQEEPDRQRPDRPKKRKRKLMDDEPFPAPPRAPEGSDQVPDASVFAEFSFSADSLELEEGLSRNLSVSDDEDYDFATHVVKVRRSGHIIDVKNLWDFDEPSLTTSSSQVPAMNKRSHLGRMQSMRAFSDSSEANEMLKGLRYFERSSKSGCKKPFSWCQVDMGTVANSIIELSQQVRSLLMQEPRLLKVEAPVYVLGDLHGNFHDLVCFEKVLWRLGTSITPCNFLFLGDYVDRGDFGVEVVAYLFAQKILAPTKFHLLRGNHEHRQIQKNFTFYSECLSKFGDEVGEVVWEQVNLAFDAMPIAAVVDGQIFCVHGGIPPPWMSLRIQDLDKVSCSLPDPEKSEPLVWEYLWNDPVPSTPSDMPEVSRLQLERNPLDGFILNFRRNTGHMFTPKALDQFLARNGLSHVIRAHEVKEAGFQVQHGQKLLTVFSSSKYCQGSNDAACVLIHGKKLRLIRLDTS